MHGGVVDLGLTDSVALVTGGAGRLGRAICTRRGCDSFAVVGFPPPGKAGGLQPGHIVTQSLEGIPLRRTGSPEDIAEEVLFLAGRNNPWMTGAIIPVTGGSHCGRTHVALSQGLR